MKASERVYRRLLRIYPRSFRNEYEEEMVHVFLDQLRDARGSGRAGQEAGLWLHSVADIVSSAPAEHLRTEESAVARPVDPGSVSISISPLANGPKRLGYAIAILPFIVILTTPVLAAGWIQPIFDNPPSLAGLPAGMVLLFIVAIWASIAFVAIRASSSRFGIALALVVFTIPSIVVIFLTPAVILAIENGRS